jgi:hypothetical protein
MRVLNAVSSVFVEVNRELTGRALGRLETRRHHSVLFGGVERGVCRVLEMAHKAGYQRNKGELHHAQTFATGAEEKNLFAIRAVSMYRDSLCVGAPGAWHLLLTFR